MVFSLDNVSLHRNNLRWNIPALLFYPVVFGRSQACPCSVHTLAPSLLPPESPGPRNSSILIRGSAATLTEVIWLPGKDKPWQQNILPSDFTVAVEYSQKQRTGMFSPTRSMSSVRVPLPGPSSTSCKVLGLPMAIHSLMYHIPINCQWETTHRVTVTTSALGENHACLLSDNNWDNMATFCLDI